MKKKKEGKTNWFKTCIFLNFEFYFDNIFGLLKNKKINENKIKQKFTAFKVKKNLNKI